MPCNPDLIDDKILTRVGASTLDYVACDGNKWQGSLKRLSYANGYKVYFSGAAGSLIQQRGKPQVPVADVRLRAGWNWIGHAPLVSYFINSIDSEIPGSDRRPRRRRPRRRRPRPRRLHRRHLRRHQALRRRRRPRPRLRFRPRGRPCCR